MRPSSSRERAVTTRRFEVAARNFEPSIATSSPPRSLAFAQNFTNVLHTATKAVPLRRRKSATVLKSGASRPSSHISSTLRRHSRSSRREERIRFMYPYR